MRQSIGIQILFLVMLTGTAFGAEDSEWEGKLQLHGFLSQGFVQTSANRFFGPSDEGSWEFREIGVNLSFQPRPDLLFSGQLLSRKAGGMYDGSIRIDYGLVDFAPIMRENMRAGVRVGRLKNPLGFYNDTRDVPFTRPSVFLPQSIYFDRVRNLELSVDGVGFYGDLQTDVGEFYLQAYAGSLDVDVNVEYAFLNADWPGKLDSNSPWLIGRLMYEWDGGRVRLAASAANGDLNYEPAPIDILSDGTVDILFWIVSAQYNEENWSLTAEYMNEPIGWGDFGFIPPNDSTAEGWYLQGTYRPLPNWELLLRYDVSYLDKDDRQGTGSTSIFGQPHNVFAKDWTLGVRWDVTSNFMLRAEYHRVEGASWLSARENNLFTTEKNWDMFAILASYRF